MLVLECFRCLNTGLSQDFYRENMLQKLIMADSGKKLKNGSNFKRFSLWTNKDRIYSDQTFSEFFILTLSNISTKN